MRLCNSTILIGQLIFCIALLGPRNLSIVTRWYLHITVSPAGYESTVITISHAVTSYDMPLLHHDDVIQEHPVIISQLDLVEEDDQITHFVTIEEQCDPEDHLSEIRIVLYW